MAELRECPFCGSEAHLTHSAGYSVVECDVKRGGCGIGCVALSDASAIQRWNTRHPPAPLMSDENVERVARAIHDSEPCSCDGEMNDAIFSEMRLARMRQARAAIQALSPSEGNEK